MRFLKALQLKLLDSEHSDEVRFHHKSSLANFEAVWQTELFAKMRSGKTTIDWVAQKSKMKFTNAAIHGNLLQDVYTL